MLVAGKPSSLMAKTSRLVSLRRPLTSSSSRLINPKCHTLAEVMKVLWCQHWLRTRRSVVTRTSRRFNMSMRLSCVTYRGLVQPFQREMELGDAVVIPQPIHCTRMVAMQRPSMSMPCKDKDACSRTLTRLSQADCRLLRIADELSIKLLRRLSLILSRSKDVL